MKPTNSPTQGQPNPRKIRVKAAFGPLFPTANNCRWVGIDFINREQTRTPTQPKFLRKYPTTNTINTNTNTNTTTTTTTIFPATLVASLIVVRWYACNHTAVRRV